LFYADRCDNCGDCFTQCQYMDYPREKAISQINALKRGMDAEILRKCITCMACNEYCPTGANPYDLICALQEKTGISLVPKGTAEFIEETLSRVPNEIIPGDPARPALSLCVMEHAYPKDVIASKMFDGLTLVKGSDYFSRIVYLHTAMESTVKQYAQKFIDNLSQLNKDEIVFMHDDCYTMAAHKAPEYGIDLPFKPVHIVEYMVRYLKEHPDSVTQLQKKIAYQRPCISRYTPEKEPFIDEFFEIIGVERVARQYDRNNALCCGFGLQQTEPQRGSEMLESNITDAKTYGAEAIVFLCPGCYWLISRSCDDCGLPSIFISDLGRMALGELAFSSRPWAGIK